MPDGGRGGFYTNWFNNGEGGNPRWEDWHIKRLIPYVDGHYRTRATRSERAIAGLSMGGFGTFSYAARHPDLFTAALSMSGAVDITVAPQRHRLDLRRRTADRSGPCGGATTPNRCAGARTTRATLPRTCAGSRSGCAPATGSPAGPSAAVRPSTSSRAAVEVMAKNVHQRLLKLEIPHVFDDYGPGHHLWPYWNRDLKETLPAIMARFRKGSRPPGEGHVHARSSRATGSTAGPSASSGRRWSSAGWRRRTASGFSLSGSGSATVTTPAAFAPRGHYRITIKRAEAPPRPTG